MEEASKYNSWGAQSSDAGYGHMCNCIGCCKKCGGCLTNPTHALTCADIEKLNKQRTEIFERAQVIIRGNKGSV